MRTISWLMLAVATAACGKPRASASADPVPSPPPSLVPPGGLSKPCFRPESEYEYVNVCWVQVDAERARAQGIEMVCAEADERARGGRSFYVYPANALAGVAQPMQPRSPRAWSGKVSGVPAALAIESSSEALLTIANETMKLRRPGASERCDARRRIAGLPPEAIEAACDELATTCKGAGERCEPLRERVKAALAQKGDLLRGSTHNGSCP